MALKLKHPNDHMMPLLVSFLMLGLRLHIMSTCCLLWSSVSPFKNVSVANSMVPDQTAPPGAVCLSVC